MPTIFRYILDELLSDHGYYRTAKAIQDMYDGDFIDNSEANACLIYLNELSCGRFAHILQ